MNQTEQLPNAKTNTNNQLQQFNFNNQNIHVAVDTNNEVWFIGKEVCELLGTETRDLRKILDNDEISNLDTIHIGGISTIIDQSNGGRAPLIVSEAGLYKLIMRSRKDNAKPFQRWVTHEVLPSIRKHGAYMTPATIENIINDPEFGIKLLTKLKDEQAKRLEAEHKQHEAEAQVRELAPKAQLMNDFVNLDSTYSVGESAKLLHNVGIPYGPQQLFTVLEQFGWIFKSNGSWSVKQDRINNGYMVLKPYVKQLVHSDGSTQRFSPQVRLTGKGLFLLQKRISEALMKQTLGQSSQPQSKVLES